MPVQVIMPQLGEGVDEGTVTKWLKVKGDPVEEYEPLLEINTDKVDTEIPSPDSGVLLDILISEGSIVQAGTLLAWIGQEGEPIPEGDTLVEEKGKQPMREVMEKRIPHPVETVPAVGRDRDLGFISPVVARIASEHKVDLSQVNGTGQGGRITKKDVLAYIEGNESKGLLMRPEDLISTQASPVQPKTGIEPGYPPVDGTPVRGEVIPFSPVRRAIADHMVSSKHTSPHATAINEVDLGRVVAHRQANKDAFGRDGIKLTFTAYFVAATVVALKAYPIVNSSWSEEGIILHPNIHIGMATSLGEEGLIVPVIKNADQLSLLGLARTINDLANRARTKSLQPDEVRGGTFTITNHGVTGSLFATPIINQPQCAILGVGAIQKRVVVVSDKENGDSIAIRPMAYLGLTFDHRILDGAVSDYFLAKVVESLGNW
jgi:2-oxoglutarate dehydrogenase E2 component (dihydrolipoamide succinyltransferase)